MRKLVLLMVLALGATVAQAGDGLFYLGAGVTHSSLTTGNYPQTDLNDTTSWKAFGGVRPLKWLAVELGYIDLGNGSGYTVSNEPVTTHEDSSAWTAYAVGFLPVPLPMVDFYGKAGVARWKLNSSISYSYLTPPYGPFTTSNSSTGTDFAWGVGVQAHISIIGARLEYEGFQVNGNYAGVASLSVFVNFL
jgi:hypothetical protein